MLWFLGALVVFAGVMYGLNALDQRTNAAYNTRFFRLRNARRLIQKVREEERQKEKNV